MGKALDCGADEAVDGDGMAGDPLEASGEADALWPVSRVPVPPRSRAQMPTTRASAPPAVSSNRVLWLIEMFLHGVSQASLARRRCVVLSWARAAQRTRSESSAGPDCRESWIWRSRSLSVVMRVARRWWADRPPRWRREGLAWRRRGGTSLSRWEPREHGRSPAGSIRGSDGGRRSPVG